TKVRYTDPSDLFLNGVMETRRGTCGNMSMVHVALAWRLGWPVSLACVHSHHITRYDDGRVRYNIEATDTGRGGFVAPTDEPKAHLRRARPDGAAAHRPRPGSPRRAALCLPPG